MKIVIGFLKLFWKEVLLVLLLAIVLFQFSSIRDKERANSILKNSRDSVARYYQDREGNLIGQIKTHEITISELKEFKDDIGIEVDELKKQIGSLNRLVSHWQGKATFIDYDTVTVALLDTVINEVHVGKFNWNNDYLSLTGLIVDRQVSLSYTYDLSFDFELTSYWKNKNLFKSGTLVTDIKFSDQRLRVGEFKGIVIKQPPKKWYETRLASFGAGLLTGVFLMR